MTEMLVKLDHVQLTRKKQWICYGNPENDITKFQKIFENQKVRKKFK